MLPWILFEVHPDTGSEFINWLLKVWCDTVNVAMTRSRPGHSNDNAHVEERNGNLVRKYIGYVRLDCVEAVEALNSVYEVLCLYLNHFRASRRLVKKYEVKGKWKKEYEKVAKTPYQRAMASPDIPEEVKNGLRSEHEKLNPVVLTREIAKRKKTLYDVQRKYGKQEI
jgi:transposase InsO family protein